MESIFNYNLLEGANIPKGGAQSKAQPARKMAHDFAEEVSVARMKVAATLKRIVDEKNLITAKELRELFGKDISTVYRYLNEDHPISSEILIPLIAVLAERGNTEILQVMIPNGYTVVRFPDAIPNGSIEDEVIHDVKHLGDCVRCFEKKDMRKVRTSAGKVITETLSIINEAETILGGSIR